MSREPVRDIKRARSPSAIASRMGGGRRSMGSGIETRPSPAPLSRGGYVGDNRTFFGEVENPDPFATYVGLSDLGGYIGGEEEEKDEEEQRLLAGFEGAPYFGYPSPHYPLDSYGRPVFGGQITAAGASFGYPIPHNAPGIGNVFGWYGGGGETADVGAAAENLHMSEEEYDDEDEEDDEEWGEEEEFDEEREGDDEGALAGIDNDHDTANAAHGNTTNSEGNPQGILALSKRMESVARAAKELFGVSIFPSSQLNQHTESSTPLSYSFSSSYSLFSSLLLPLTDINLEAIVASGVPITLTLCFEGSVQHSSGATAKVGAAQQRFVSSDLNGARGILTYIRECISKKKFFDVSKIELYVTVLQEKRELTATDADGINNTDNSPQQGSTSLSRIGGFLTFVASPFNDGDGNRNSPHEQHDGQTMISALPALLRLFGSSANQKLLLDVGDFWSPFLLNVVGSAATQMENVLDLRTCIAACSGVPECRLVDPSSSVANNRNGGGPLNYLSIPRPEDDDGNSPYWAIAAREGLWNPPTHSSIAGDAYPLLRRAFATGFLYQEIMESFSRAPVLSATTPPRRSDNNGFVVGGGGGHHHHHASPLASSSSSTLMVAAQRETAALYACALMSHNGLHVDVAKAVRLLARLVGRSRQLYAAIDEVLLGPLRKTSSKVRACDRKSDEPSLNKINNRGAGGTVGGQEEGSAATIDDPFPLADAAFDQQQDLLVEGSETAQNSTHSLSNKTQIQAVLPFPETERDLVALIARYWSHFVAAGVAPPTPSLTTTLSSTSQAPLHPDADDYTAAMVVPSDFSVASLSEPSFLRRCPIAAAWAYAKSLREVGSTLQRFLRPLGPDIAASVLAAEELQRSRVESERLAFEEEQSSLQSSSGVVGGRGGGGKGFSQTQTRPPSLSRLPIPLPLLDVHPTFNLNSVTGRIFARNPNVQTLRASPMFVTSGDELTDRLVERLIVSWRTQFCCSGGAGELAGLDAGTLSSPPSAARCDAEMLTDLAPRSRLARLSLNLRALFVAPPGTIMLSFDYNQIELRVLAHLSRDPNLMKAFAAPSSEPEKNEKEKLGEPTSAGPEQSSSGNDVLSYVASLMFNLPSEDVVTPSQRSQAKIVVYGLLYGMGNKALQQRLDEALKEGRVSSSSANTPRAAELRDLFNTAFPVATAYLNSVGSEACVTRIVSTMGGKYRQLHIDHQPSGGGEDQHPSPQNHHQWWSHSRTTSSGGYGYDQNQMVIRNQAVSMRIQGSAADILKGAMADLAKGHSPTSPRGGNTGEKQLNANPPLPFAMLLSLHDELVFVCPDARRKKKRGSAQNSQQQQQDQQKTLLFCCPVEDTIKYISAVMESQADRFGMRVPLKVSAKIGKTFGELRGLE